MTREEAVRLAKEAGFIPMPGGLLEGIVLRFAALVAQAEREACARVCEELSFTPQGPTLEAKHQRNLCAAAIRARNAD